MKTLQAYLTPAERNSLNYQNGSRTVLRRVPRCFNKAVFTKPEYYIFLRELSINALKKHMQY
eukprot:m.136219 g.136219  ORF g.136219 m.136219 type:complete len:62 (+) comp14725_c0_seq5:2649-2834(+)